MSNLLAVLFITTGCIVIVFGTNHHKEDRIIGGSEASQDKYPFVASILINVNAMKFKLCGGSVVKVNWILTAAHCITGTKKEQLQVSVGSDRFDGGTHYKVQKIIIYPEYNANEGDIALIKLASPISDYKRVKKIALNKDNVEFDTDAKIFGWGATSTSSSSIPKLQVVNVKTVSCQPLTILAQLFGIFKEDPKLICTSTKNSKGACTGDSGGPLISGRKQIGIVSRGRPCARGQPDVYTNVSYYVDWIQGTINKN